MKVRVAVVLFSSPPFFSTGHTKTEEASSILVASPAFYSHSSADRTKTDEF